MASRRVVGHGQVPARAGVGHLAGCYTPLRQTIAYPVVGGERRPSWRRSTVLHGGPDPSPALVGHRAVRAAGPHGGVPGDLPAARRIPRDGEDAAARRRDRAGRGRRGPRHARRRRRRRRRARGHEPRPRLAARDRRARGEPARGVGRERRRPRQHRSLERLQRHRGGGRGADRARRRPACQRLRRGLQDLPPRRGAQAHQRRGRRHRRPARAHEHRSQRAPPGAAHAPGRPAPAVAPADGQRDDRRAGDPAARADRAQATARGGDRARLRHRARRAASRCCSSSSAAGSTTRPRSRTCTPSRCWARSPRAARSPRRASA